MVTMGKHCAPSSCGEPSTLLAGLRLSWPARATLSLGLTKRAEGNSKEEGLSFTH
jgi:hypothetical protein